MLPSKFRVMMMVPVLAWSAVAAQAPTYHSPEEWNAARQAIVDGNKAWSAARMAADRATFERMLLPDAWVQMGDHRLSRQEFIEQISAPQPGSKLRRFDAGVLTVMPEDDHWVAIIEEKLEFERPGKNGGMEKRWSLWVTKDAWKQNGGEWKIASSTALGMQVWPELPPIPNW